MDDKSQRSGAGWPQSRQIKDNSQDGGLDYIADEWNPLLEKLLKLSIILGEHVGSPNFSLQGHGYSV
jgi:hypothetical protein